VLEHLDDLAGDVDAHHEGVTGRRRLDGLRQLRDEAPQKRLACEGVDEGISGRADRHPEQPAGR
jgi:hypothetical protein